MKNSFKLPPQALNAMRAATRKAKAAAEGRSDNAVRDELAAITSLRRFVDPDDIAAMIVFLCGDGGRSVTGQALSIDSGMEGYVMAPGEPQV